MRPVCSTLDCSEFANNYSVDGKPIILCSDCAAARGLESNGKSFDDGIRPSTRFAHMRRVMTAARAMLPKENREQQVLKIHQTAIGDTVEIIHASTRKRFRFPTQEAVGSFLHVDRGQVMRAIKKHSTIKGYEVRDLANKRIRKCGVDALKP